MAEQNGSSELANYSNVESDVEKAYNDTLQQLAPSSELDKTTLNDLLQQLVAMLDSSSDVELDTLNDLFLQLVTRMMRSADQKDAVLSYFADMLPLSTQRMQLLINLDEYLSRSGVDHIRRAKDNAHALSQEWHDLFDRFKRTVEDYRFKHDDVEYRRLLCTMMKENIMKLRQVEEQFAKIDREVNKRAFLRGLIQVTYTLNGSS